MGHRLDFFIRRFPVATLGSDEGLSHRVVCAVAFREKGALVNEVGRILSNVMEAKGIWRMDIQAPHIASSSKPGQFVNVKVTDQLDPLLRRPISLYGIDSASGTISLLYLVVGRGTELMSKMEEGDSVDIVGPLGNGFDLDVPGTRIVLLGGGIGIAPLYPLAQGLIAKGKDVKLLFGAKDKDSIAGTKPFEKLGIPVEISTDDGSFGYHGFVTDLLEQTLAQGGCDYLFICGPTPMIKVAQQLLARGGVAGQVSTESRMGCGLGVCLCCPIKVKSGGYKRVCKDGPVFDIEVLDYE